EAQSPGSQPGPDSRGAPPLRRRRRALAPWRHAPAGRRVARTTGPTHLALARTGAHDALEEAHMGPMNRFFEYAQDFEKTYVDDDWSRLARYFHPDAVYEV